MAQRRVEVLSQRRLLDDFFEVDEVILRHQQADGRMSRPLRRLHLARGDAVAALLYDPERRVVVLVRQFRYPTWPQGYGWLLEIVAGLLDAGESPEEAVAREALEETGYRTGRLERILSFYATPGGSSERIILFYAEVGEADRVGQGCGRAEEDEDIEVVELPLEEACSALDRGEIVDAKSIVALMWLRHRLRCG